MRGIFQKNSGPPRPTTIVQFHDIKLLVELLEISDRSLHR